MNDTVKAIIFTLIIIVVSYSILTLANLASFMPTQLAALVEMIMGVYLGSLISIKVVRSMTRK